MYGSVLPSRKFPEGPAAAYDEDQNSRTWWSSRVDEHMSVSRRFSTPLRSIGSMVAMETWYDGCTPIINMRCVIWRPAEMGTEDSTR